MEEQLETLKVRLFFMQIKKLKVLKMQLKKQIEEDPFKLRIIKNTTSLQKVSKKKLEMFLRVFMKKTMSKLELMKILVAILKNI